MAKTLCEYLIIMYTVRIADASDALELIDLNRLNNGADHIASDIAYVAGSLENNTSELIFVAESKGKLIGFACIQILKSFAYHRPSIEITEIFVMEPFRNKGVGKSLLDKITECCSFNNALELL